MLGDGIVSFGVARATERRNVKSSAKMHFSSLSLPRHPHRRRRELDVALFVVKLDLQVVLGLGDPANLIDEVHVPRGATVLAIGDTL